MVKDILVPRETLIYFKILRWLGVTVHRCDKNVPLVNLVLWSVLNHVCSTVFVFITFKPTSINARDSVASVFNKFSLFMLSVTQVLLAFYSTWSSKSIMVLERNMKRFQQTYPMPKLNYLYVSLLLTPVTIFFGLSYFLIRDFFRYDNNTFWLFVIQFTHLFVRSTYVMNTFIYCIGYTSYVLSQNISKTVNYLEQFIVKRGRTALEPKIDTNSITKTYKDDPTQFKENMFFLEAVISQVSACLLL